MASGKSLNNDISQGRTDYKSCPFCNGSLTFIYKMGEYRIEKCLTCKTGLVNPMPTSDELSGFYDGFMFAADMRNMPVVRKSSRLLFSELGFETGRKMEMLDVGGGGGFFSKAFEDFGYGRSTYIDIDAKASEFAGKELGISTAINADVTEYKFDKRFDFIMCRHIIEHLITPHTFIIKMTELLSDKGILLIMCPNGESLEYFSYPKLGLLKRAKTIRDANNISFFHVFGKFLTGNILHGIDPPRHLWAITIKGLTTYLTNHSLDFNIYTRNLADRCYSPYYTPKTVYDKSALFFADIFFARIHGGTHLVLVIKK